MKFSPGDQQSLLEVIDDYFTSNNGCDSDRLRERTSRYNTYSTTQYKIKEYEQLWMHVFVGNHVVDADRL